MIQTMPIADSFPDPYEPVNMVVPDHGTAGGGKRRQKRAMVLAQARRLIIEERFTGFTVKRLSQMCGVSSQALFYKYSSRDRIMSTAINDYSLSLFQYGRAISARENDILSFADCYAESCGKYPEFMNRVLPNTFFDRNGSLVFARCNTFGVLLIHRALLDMRKKGLIEGGADLRVAAAAMSTLLSATLLDWSRGAVRQDQLRHTLTYKIELVCLGLQASERRLVSHGFGHS